MDIPLLARDIAAAVLLLISLALPWWQSALMDGSPASFSWGGAEGGQSLPATIFTVLAVFACVVTYIAPVLFGARVNSLAQLGLKGVIVAPLLIMGVIAVAQTLLGDQRAGPAVVVALTGAVLTLQTADRERHAVTLWRTATLALAGVTALVAIIWFIVSLPAYGDSGGALAAPTVTLAVSLLVVGAVVGAVTTGRPFTAGVALAGAAGLAAFILDGLIAQVGGVAPLTWGMSPGLVPQFLLVAAATAPALYRRVPALTGPHGWVAATCGFALVTAVLWGVEFLLGVAAAILITTGSGSFEGLGLLIWLLTLQAIGALAFAITYRLVTTNLGQGRVMALVAAGVLGVAAVVTWAVGGVTLPFATGAPSILTFSLVLAGLVTIPPVMRATPMQPLSRLGAQSGPPVGYPGQPYPGPPGTYQPGPGQPFPRPGHHQGPPAVPGSGAAPARPGPFAPHPNSGPQHQGHPQSPDLRKASPPDEDDEW